MSAASDRCLHCWRDIAAVPPLPPEEAASALKVEAALARRREGTWLTPGRAFRYGTAAFVLLFLAWWVYATFIDKPPRPDMPSSTARSAAAGSWTTQDGDNRNTRSTQAPAHVGGTEAWRVELGSPAATSLVTDGHLIVAPLEDGRLVGLEAATGATRWTVKLNNPPFSAPVLAGDRVYVAQREGLLMVLSAADGNEVWHSRYVAGSFEASPLVVDGVVYVYSTDGVFAFDAENGRILWEQVFDVAWATVAPAVEGKYLTFATADRALVYDRTSGQRTYFVTFSRSQPSSLALRDGDVFALYGRDASMFDVSSRRPWWDGIRGAWFRFHVIGMAPSVPPPPTMWDVNSLPRTTMAAAFGEDTIVVTSRDGDVRGLGRADGAQKWSAAAGRLAAAPMITADGVLLVGEGRLLLLDLATGKQLSERAMTGLRGATPTSEATYVSTVSGAVIALR